MLLVKRLLLVLPLLLTACGGGGDDAQDAYVAEATKVCEVAETDADALTSPTSAAGIKPFVDGTLAIATRAQGDLAALTPPPDDAAELEAKVLTPFAELVEEGKAYAAEVDAAGTDGAKLLALVAEQPSAEGIDLEYLRSYGLGVCADVIDTSG
ncbi:MAG: hypothetical protein JWN08_2732 [Frankiales bacterium]|jgi:hypothetical protein|nr:hypothetical protein [Frankiales bacterium]